MKTCQLSCMILNVQQNLFVPHLRMFTPALHCAMHRHCCFRMFPGNGVEFCQFLTGAFLFRIRLTVCVCFFCALASFGEEFSTLFEAVCSLVDLLRSLHGLHSNAVPVPVNLLISTLSCRRRDCEVIACAA